MDNIVFLVGGGMIVILAAIILIQSKKTIFWTAFILVFLPIDYLNRYFFNVPTLVRWLPLFAMVGFSILTIFVMTERKAKPPKTLVWIYRIILAISIISMLHNHTTIPALLVSQRGFIMVFAFMSMLKVAYYLYSKDEIMQFVVWAGLASSCAAIFQRVVFVMGMGRSGDMVAGLFPVDGIYLYFSLVVISIVISYWLNGKEVLPMIPSTTILMIMMLGLALGNNKAGFVFLAVVILFVAGLAGFKKVMQNFGKLFAGMAMLAIVMVIFNTMYNSTYESQGEENYAEAIQDPEYIRRYLFGGDQAHQKFAPSGQLLRGASVEFAYLLIDDEPETMMIGLGPGATMKSNMPGANGWLDTKFPGYKIGRVPLSMFIAEIGFVGLALQIIFLFAIYYWKPKYYWMDRPEFKLSRKAFVITTLLFFMYENLYFEPVLALLIGVMVYPDYLSRPQQQEERDVEEKEQSQVAVTV